MSDAVLGAAELGELALEGLNLGAADKGSRAESLAEGLDQVVLEFTMGRHQVEERNRIVCHTNAPGITSVSISRGVGRVVGRRGQELHPAGAQPRAWPHARAR